MKFSKENIESVEKRLRKYEEYLASEQFQPLDKCNVCETIPSSTPCMGCLFYHDGTSCWSRVGCGVNCRTKEEQWQQYNHLLDQLEKNGYEFVEVDNG